MMPPPHQSTTMFSSTAERQARNLWMPMFIVFGLTRPEIKPEFSVSVADALSTRPLIGFNTAFDLARPK